MSNIFSLLGRYFVLCYFVSFAMANAQNLGKEFLQPIETEHLLIRPLSFSAEDRKNFKLLCADNTQSYVRFCGNTDSDFKFQAIVTVEKAYPYLAFWAIFDKEHKEFLGGIRIQSGLSENGIFLWAPEFVIQLLPQARGRGFGKEAGSAVMARYDEFAGCPFPITPRAEKKYLQDYVTHVLPTLIEDYDKISASTRQYYIDTITKGLCEASALGRENKPYVCLQHENYCNIISDIFATLQGKMYTLPPEPLKGLTAIVDSTNTNAQKLVQELGFIYQSSLSTYYAKHYIRPFKKSAVCKKLSKQDEEL